MDDQLDLNVYNFDNLYEDENFKNQNLNLNENYQQQEQENVFPQQEQNMNLNDVYLENNNEEKIQEEQLNNSHEYSFPENTRKTNEENASISSYVGSDLTPEEELKKKKVLLFKLKRFQKKGYTLSRPYNLESDLIDIQAEVESIKREANLGASVETMKKGLMVSTYLLEVLNSKFDPINAKLDGWSNQIKDDIDAGDFDEVFEELYDKYTDSLDMPPEIKLLSMLGTSALQYHIAHVIVTETLDKPTTTEILSKNPQIKKDIMNAVNKTDAGRKIHYNMKQPSSDFDNILAELEIEDENSKLQNQEILSESVLSTDF